MTFDPSSAAPVLHPVHNWPGHLGAGDSVCRTSLQSDQQLHLWDRRRRLRLQTGQYRPHRTHFHLRGCERLFRDHRYPNILLPDPDCAESGPGHSLCCGSLHHVEAPVPGLFRWSADRLPLLPAVAEGLVSWWQRWWEDSGLTDQDWGCRLCDYTLKDWDVCLLCVPYVFTLLSLYRNFCSGFPLKAFCTNFIHHRSTSALDQPGADILRMTWTHERERNI